MLTLAMQWSHVHDELNPDLHGGFVLVFHALQRHAAMLLIALMFLTGACISERTVVGNIPPSTFQFKTVVEYKSGVAGGWQIAQVIVLLGRLSAMFPRAATCDVEVGVPVKNELQGFITVEKAQLESAAASDRAARKIMAEHEGPTVSICALFRDTMSYYLGSREVGTIYGARVTAFTNGWSVPRRTFPPRRGRKAR